MSNRERRNSEDTKYEDELCQLQKKLNLKTNIAISFVKLLQNLSLEEKLRQLIREETRKEKEVEREGLVKLVETFNLFCQSNVLHAEIYPHVTVISFEEAQSHPEYQAELESVRSDSFFSPSSISLSDEDIENIRKCWRSSTLRWQGRKTSLPIRNRGPQNQ